jgi:hypothetical protein
LIGRLDWRELTDESHPMYVRIAPLLPRYLPSGGAHDFNFRPSSDLDDIMFITYHLLLEAPLASDNYQLDYRTRQLTARYHPDSLMSVAEVISFNFLVVWLFFPIYCSGRRRRVGKGFSFCARLFGGNGRSYSNQARNVHS